MGVVNDEDGLHLRFKVATEVQGEEEVIITLVTGELFVSAAEWIHVTVGYSNIGELKLYINGVRDNSNCDPCANESDEETVLINEVEVFVFGIGILTGNSVANLIGSLDDLQIYNRALTEDEVLEVYNTVY